MGKKFHTCSRRSIFCQVHAPAENVFTVFSACAENSAKLFLQSESTSYDVLFRLCPAKPKGFQKNQWLFQKPKKAKEKEKEKEKEKKKENENDKDKERAHLSMRPLGYSENQNSHFLAI